MTSVLLNYTVWLVLVAQLIQSLQHFLSCGCLWHVYERGTNLDRATLRMRQKNQTDQLAGSFRLAVTICGSRRSLPLHVPLLVAPAIHGWNVQSTRTEDGLAGRKSFRNPNLTSTCFRVFTSKGRGVPQDCCPAQGLAMLLICEHSLLSFPPQTWHSSQQPSWWHHF